MTANAQSTEAQDSKAIAATPVGDGSDRPAYQAADNTRLHDQAIALLYNGADSRANYPGRPDTAATVSLAAISQDGSIRMSQLNWGQYTQAAVENELAEQNGEAPDQVARLGDRRANDRRTRHTNDGRQVTEQEFRQRMEQLGRQRNGADRELANRVNTFLSRQDISPEDKRSIMTNLVNLADGRGFQNGGVSDENTRRAIVSGIIDNLAHPDKIDQTGTNTCNATSVQEQLYRFNARETVERATNMFLTGRYTADKVDAQGNRIDTGRVDANGRKIYETFEARIPPNYLRTLTQLSQGDQTSNGALNAATSGLSVGMLNHFWQQRGRYYSIERPDGQTAINGRDTNGEILADYNRATNSFTRNNLSTGNPATDAYAVADMGVAAGLTGQFVLARGGWLRGERNHAAIARISNQADISTAMNRLGRNSAIMVMDVGNAIQGVRGGHVLSITARGDNQFTISDQNGTNSLEGRVSDTRELFAYMAHPQGDGREVPPRGYIAPEGPRGPRRYDGIVPGNEWHNRHGQSHFERQREQERTRQGDNTNGRKDEQQAKDTTREATERQARLDRQDRQRETRARATTQSLMAQINSMESRLAQLEASMKPDHRAQASSLTASISNLRANLQSVSNIA